MRYLKKILMCALCALVVVGASFGFAGCSKLDGKSYTFHTMTFTIITNTETKDDGEIIITETRELTAEEYYLYKVKNIALDKLAGKNVEEGDKAAYEAWFETFYPTTRNSIVTFNDGIMTFTERKELINGMVKENIVSGAYGENEAGKYVVSFTKNYDGEFAETIEVAYMNFTIDANEKIHFEVRNQSLTSNSQLIKGALYLTNLIYAEIDN